jgi:CO/xanthine dehydrogenase FAD-binding subunit
MNVEPRYVRPATIGAAQTLRAELGDRAVFAGGFTALQLGWGDARPTACFIDVSTLSFGADAALDGDGKLVMAANARLQRLYRDPLVAQTLPVLTSALAALASPSVRNLATLGGNLVWGAGDLEALLAALGARVQFADGSSAPVSDRSAWPANGLLTRAEIPLPNAGSAFYEKLGHREAFSPARIVVAGCLRGDRIRAALRFAGGQVRSVAVAASDAAVAIEALVRPGDHAYLARAGRAMLAGHLESLPGARIA